VSADQKCARARGVGVKSLNEFVQTVRDAVVELRYALALCRGDDDRVLFGSEVVWEVLSEDVVSCWRRVIEASKTVELAQTSLEVDGSLQDFGVFGVLCSAGSRERCQGLDAAVEGT